MPIILGHLSTGPKNSHEEAIEIMIDSIENDKATLYVDTSWVDLDDIILLIEKLKNTKKGDFTHRIMWASDAPVGDFNQNQYSYEKNLKLFINKINEHFNDKELLELLLYKNAKNLYKL